MSNHKISQLSHVAKVCMGQSPEATFVNEDEFGFPFLQGNADFTSTSPKEKYWCSRPKKIAKPDSVLVSVRAPVGEINIADKKYCIGRGLAAVDFYKIDKEFGRFLFIKNIYQLEVKSQGTTFLAVSKKDIDEMLLSYPVDTEEQRKIAEVLITVDETIEKTTAIIEKYTAIKRGLMQDLLNKGEAILLGEFADFIIGLTYKPSDITADGTPVLRANNVQEMRIELNDLVRVVTPIGKKLWLQENDILMCSRNGSENLVGKIAKIKDIQEPSTFGAFMTIVRSKANPYLYFWFQTNEFRKQIGIGTTTTIYQITSSMLKKMKIVLPTDEKQKEIAEKLATVEDKIETERYYLAKLQNIKSGLMQDLLTNKVSVETLLEEEAI